MLLSDEQTKNKKKTNTLKNHCFVSPTQISNQSSSPLQRAVDHFSLVDQSAIDKKNGMKFTTV